MMVVMMVRVFVVMAVVMVGMVMARMVTMGVLLASVRLPVLGTVRLNTDHFCYSR
jgi:hypothetical protein